MRTRFFFALCASVLAACGGGGTQFSSGNTLPGAPDDATTMMSERPAATASFPLIQEFRVPGTLTGQLVEGHDFAIYAAEPTSVERVLNGFTNIPAPPGPQGGLAAPFVALGNAPNGDVVYGADEGIIVAISTVSHSARVVVQFSGVNVPVPVPVTAVFTAPTGDFWYAFTVPNEPDLGEIFITNSSYQQKFPQAITRSGGYGPMIVGPDRMVWAAGESDVHLPQFDIKPSLDRIDPFTRKLLHSYALPATASITAMVSQSSLNSVWFADAGRNVIGRIVTTTGFIQTFRVAIANAGLAGIALGQDGNLWFTESNANKIGRFNPAGAGTFTEYPVPTANAGLGQIVPYSARRFFFAERHALAKITY